MNSDTDLRGGERGYDNRRRAAQAAANRQRVLDAAVALLSDGAEELTVPRVADRAGVSVPTVYRNFPTREDLLAAVDAAVLRSVSAPASPEDARGLAEDAPARHAHFARNAEALRAAARRPAQREVHEAGRRARDRDLAQALAAPTAHLGADDRRALAALLRVLTGTEAFLVLHDRFGLPPDVSGRVVGWAVERLAAAAAEAVGPLAPRVIRAPDAP
jgi:AcrR family transcriptional regulator